MNVLEVNKTDYETCNSDNLIHNWTTGAGRDVVPLNVTRPYYFISGKGFCHGGMKVAIYVENPPPPPSSAPVKSDSSRYTSRRQIVIPHCFPDCCHLGLVHPVLVEKRASIMLCT